MVLLVTALAIPFAAFGAAAYRITTDPSEPRVGEPATIVIGTLVYVDPPATPSEPLPLDEFLWTFVAESPRGERHEIALTRVDSSANEWTATFVFDETGQWEIGLDRPHLGTPADPSLGARKPVTVRSPDDGPLASPIIVAVVSVFVAILAVVIARRSASPRA